MKTFQNVEALIASDLKNIDKAFSCYVVSNAKLNYNYTTKVIYTVEVSQADSLHLEKIQSLGLEIFILRTTPANQIWLGLRREKKNIIIEELEK